MRYRVFDFIVPFISSVTRHTGRVLNSLTGQVLEVGLGWPVLVDVGDWARLTQVVRSGLDWSQTGLYKRSYESRNSKYFISR